MAPPGFSGYRSRAVTSEPAIEGLDPEQLAFLDRYGFDAELFARWQQQVASGELSKERNQVQGKLVAPGADSIHALPKRETPERQELEQLGLDAIGRGEFGVVILNGGMATRFGGVVKGVVPVTGDRSFLALKVGDVRRLRERCGAPIHVYMMNSFATDEATREHFAKHDNFGLPADEVHHFTQFVSIRMTETGEVFRTDSGEVSPYGPGHGDFAPALRASGCLKHFQEAGGKYLFLANVDNLGARVDATMLGHHIAQKAQVTIEVAPKWPGDAGGSPYLYEGKLQLVEQIRYPEGFDPDIVDVFNTNTFHFSADCLDRDFDLGWYFVEKKVDDRKAVQVERLVGEMSRFLKSNFVKVKRTGPQCRFFPIKTPEDLESGRDEIAELFDQA